MKELLHDVILFIQYDGTNFAGFELQPGQRTIRGELEKTLAKVYQQKISIISAARTDAGAHALENVVSFKAKNSIPLDKIPTVLNTVLPRTIRIIKAEKNNGHVRHDAKTKIYEYLIFNGENLPPQLNHLVWQVGLPLNLTAMKRAARYLVGKHDFSSFCAAHSDDKDFVKKIHSFDICSALGGSFVIWGGVKYRLIRIRVTGDGFLYKMVRNIVGTLVCVGLGKLTVADVKGILEAKDRQKAGRTAPAQGLCLVKIRY
ncbi:tRNA pseudouridine(38-40) synthase TruA [Candidatus Saganbacteria bacterium]|nr:tRNA pseudouridine(38-40) synthase TruA [Candidatus Saganbacteria bacterium]